MKSFIKHTLLIAFLLAVLIGIFFATPWIADNWFGYNVVKNNLGDVFTMTSALFTGLAFLGVVTTLVLQMQEFKKQQNQIQDQKKLLDKQLETAKITAQLNTLPALIESIVESLSYKVTIFICMNRLNYTYISIRDKKHPKPSCRPLPITQAEEKFFPQLKKIVDEFEKYCFSDDVMVLLNSYGNEIFNSKDENVNQIKINSNLLYKIQIKDYENIIDFWNSQLRQNNELIQFLNWGSSTDKHQTEYEIEMLYKLIHYKKKQQELFDKL